MYDVDVLAAGEAMAVLSPDPPVALRDAAMLSMSVAGAEANVAVHLARLGLRTVFASRVGDDPFGELIRDRLAGSGVVPLLETDPAAPTGVYFKDPGPGGTRVHYYRAGSAASAMDARVWQHWPRARLVHLSGITPALSAACADLVFQALTHRTAGDAIMSFDVNHRPKLWPADVAGPRLASLANEADVVFVGLDEAQTLWGTRTAADVREVISRPGQLVVKDGAVGATVFGPAGTVFEPAVPVEVLEPVGAGDAFAAGYLFGLLTGHEPAARLRFGHHLAGHALRTTADVGAAVTASAITAAVLAGGSTTTTTTVTATVTATRTQEHSHGL